jgi:hypothetical protein
MNGNIDDELKIVDGDDKKVTATGWLKFKNGDPPQVTLWVGVGQGDRKPAANGAVYGDGSTQVKGAAGSVVKWTCDAEIDGAGKYVKGKADAGAVVIYGGVKPYPWGRDVQLTDK